MTPFTAEAAVQATSRSVCTRTCAQTHTEVLTESLEDENTMGRDKTGHSGHGQTPQ